MSRWRIYYADGSTFDHRDGSAFDAPAERGMAGAQPVLPMVMRVEDATGKRRVLQGKDYFVWVVERQSWVMVDLAGLLTNYLRRPGPQKVLVCGLHFDDDAFWYLVARAEREAIGA